MASRGAALQKETLPATPLALLYQATQRFELSSLILLTTTLPANITPHSPLLRKANPVCLMNSDPAYRSK
jgi:hypothetical protein